VRDIELGRAYEESGEEILQELQGRLGPLPGSSHGGEILVETEAVDDEGLVIVLR
jgi:hypothetical protein